MRRAWIAVASLSLAAAAGAQPRTVVFQETDFPAVESEAPPREALRAALEGRGAEFVGLEALAKPETLAQADLLVLPYGSAFPADAWPAIRAHLERGGNLLTLGGRALWVPVFKEGEGGARHFRAGAATNAYWKLMASVHAAEVPRRDFTRFAWDLAYAFTASGVRARRVFALNTQFVANYAPPQGNWRGLGFFLDEAGRRIAAPLTRLDFALTPPAGSAQGHGRLVMLNFEPEPGFWGSAAGRQLVREAAEHAAQGPALVWAELLRASLAEGEDASAVLHVHDRGVPRAAAVKRELGVELRKDGALLDTQQIQLPAAQYDATLSFPKATTPGLYEIRATLLRNGVLVDLHETGFWRRDPRLLTEGPALTVGSTYLKKAGKPYLPIGVNMWVNDTVQPIFPENANALEWERDFAELKARGLTFVRTGIWHERQRLIGPATGAAEERVLRNLEAMLLSAGRHGLHINFTIFVFDPQTWHRRGESVLGPGQNPYTDPVAIEAQQTFVRSLAARFKDVPHLSWDLINEPSFSNPRTIFRGNQPNNDPTEQRAWNDWLKQRYGTGRVLAEAWGAIPTEFGEIGGVPLPEAVDLGITRNGNPKQVRALDYNLFAQDLFARWARTLARTIHETGSRQLVMVGQDEGGVTNRPLNHFYGGDGVDVTSLHNWWYDDALLWSSVAAKRPGVPNLLGETGPQPSVAMDGQSRWDETKGLGLTERKLALGLAAGNAGSAVWIWSRTDPFRFGNQDGSSSLWIDALTQLGQFAQAAEPHLSDARPGDVALVLPQSLQLSAFNDFALEAQQKSVRALYQHARASAYAVGEYQLGLMGNPKLILLPSPWVLSPQAWAALADKVEAGATLLVTGRFDQDEHFRPTDRARTLGLAYEPRVLDVREHAVRWPGGAGRAIFSGNKTTFLEQASLAGGASFARQPLGKGQVLFFSLPLELNDDLDLLGAVYRYALTQAGVAPVYRTALDDPGILICPTVLEQATLYVLTSESAERREVAFKDVASGADLRATLEPGRAAILLVTRAGQVVARYGP